MACMRVSLLFLSLETHVHTDITNRIVAMGYPSCGKEARYRNPLVDVQRFITQFHDGHYRIYNLCSEREYDVRRCTIIPRTHTLSETPEIHVFARDMSASMHVHATQLTSSYRPRIFCLRQRHTSRAPSAIMSCAFPSRTTNHLLYR